MEDFIETVNLIINLLYST